MSLLEIENLNLWYGDRQVLYDVSLSLEEGQILCIVGESGSGKSSLLYAINGLLPNNARLEGSIRFKGREITHLTDRERKRLRGKDIGMVFQEPSTYLDPLFSVGTQIEETYRAHFPKAKDSREKSLEAMRRSGIPKVEERFGMYPHQLSGGLKQRVCIAIALVCEPSLLLADEPTTALDVSVQKRILALFREIKSEGRSVLLVTHDFGVVAEVADSVAVLKEGRIVERADVYSIFDNPREGYTKLLLSAI
jgi:peptide/nickel transport system ATP-binding protein